MSNVKLKRILPSSLAKVFALYSFFLALLISLVDVLLKVVTNNSMFVGLESYGSMFLFLLIYLILSPIFAYVVGLIVGFIINFALRIANGLDFEME